MLDYDGSGKISKSEIKRALNGDIDKIEILLSKAREYIEKYSEDL